jgi:hypothetical protein
VTFTLPPEAYTYSEPNLVNPTASPSCVINVYESTGNFTVFGTQFFTQYAAEFNYNKNTIGFAL